MLATKLEGHTMPAEDGVAFVIEYEDGRKVRMVLQRHEIIRGDHVARTIAEDRLNAGSLRRGTIKSVTRE